MRRLAFIAPSALVLSVALVAAAHGNIKQKGGGSASFHAVGPGGLKIEGKAGKPEVTQNGDTLVVKVPLKGHLKTGIDLRDKHCGKAINVDTWPASSFSAKVKDLKFPAPGKKVDDASITGDFKFNGVTKPMTFTYDAEFDKGKVVVKGHGTFDYTQFKVEEQCYLGVCVKKDVKIAVEFTVERDG
jgi:polyisoprenoid-binding protein YceI